MKLQHDNELDKLFAEKLSNLKADPPESAWRTIAPAVISTTAGLTVWSSIMKPIVWSLSVVSMLFVLTTSNTQNNKNSLILEKKQVLAKNTELSINNKELIKTDEKNDIQSNKYIEDKIIPTINQNEKFIAKNETGGIINDNTKVYSRMESPSLMSSLHYKSISEITSKHSPEFLNSEYNLSQKEDYIRTPWLYLSFNTGPDVFAFNNNAVDFKSWGTNYGLGLSMHMSEFFFSTGLNFLNISQKNTYNYTTNEYQEVGEYTIVDSISFVTQYDSLSNPYLVPVYYTSSHPYYDSVSVAYNTHSYDDYRFFEIPMMIGLKKDIRRFTIYAQTGFTYTFSLNAKELSRDYFEETSGTQTLSWNPLTEQRLENFWSFSLGIGAYYNTKHNVSIGIEPHYRYYIDPFFSGPGADQRTPVSYGLRLRLLYKL